ncbi:MAG TPA: M1 family metallopeptidase [Solirubrobacter sp.]|nr:M1 family metallopeptidase [Solirubrobacter sp.]
MVFRLGMLVAVCLLLAAGSAQASGGKFSPGAPGIGDPDFPLDGNGGYDVSHYDLNFEYDPSTDVLRGLERIDAKAKQNLSSFNLDLVGMNVRAVFVEGDKARWRREGDELVITPRKGLRSGRKFSTVIAYDGVPVGLEGAGFIHTDDGTLVAGQPHVAASWYAVNDHPLDKASYTFRIAVPRGLEAVANGELEDVDNVGRWTVWRWDAREPMASYLTTASIGEFDIKAYKAQGVKYYDAIDPDLFRRPAPRTGRRFALSNFANDSYKRLARTIDVPSGGAKLSFWVDRNTELNWDFFFVEAHTVGQDDWTTLPDLNGHTDQNTGFSCFFHPFLEHYQSVNADGGCDPQGTTGTWNATSGAGEGYEQWVVDLTPYRNKRVEVSLSYASDTAFNFSGVFVDDIAVTGAAGSTSFETGLDGWTTPPAPDGSGPNENTWFAGTAADAPDPAGVVARRTLARQPEIIRYLAGIFGHYPFSSAGSIVDDHQGLGFALENQTRVVYARDWFDDRTDELGGESVVVHELAHQWTGDYLALAGWQHIWLNEGFATYSEWLWSEAQGRQTAQEFFDDLASIPADDSFWALAIGDPGPDGIFDGAVYDRGAMTLQALRVKIGEHAFFRLLRDWVRANAGGNVAIPQFIALAEKIARQNLKPFFQEWLFTPAKPASLGDTAAARTLSASDLRHDRAPDGQRRRVR